MDPVHTRQQYPRYQPFPFPSFLSVLLRLPVTTYHRLPFRAPSHRQEIRPARWLLQTSLLV